MLILMCYITFNHTNESHDKKHWIINEQICKEQWKKLHNAKNE